jgi:hypothetical protein
MRDKFLDKLVEALLIATGPLAIAILARFG